MSGTAGAQDERMTKLFGCLRGPTKYCTHGPVIYFQSLKGKPVARRGRKASGL
jgi:hypothetical protein